jgi:hypothetical protein
MASERSRTGVPPLIPAVAACPGAEAESDPRAATGIALEPVRVPPGSKPHLVAWRVVAISLLVEVAFRDLTCQVVPVHPVAAVLAQDQGHRLV